VAVHRPETEGQLRESGGSSAKHATGGDSVRAAKLQEATLELLESVLPLPAATLDDAMCEGLWDVVAAAPPPGVDAPAPLLLQKTRLTDSVPLIRLWGVAASLLGAHLGQMQHRERLNRLLMFPTGSFSSRVVLDLEKNETMPCHDARAATHRAWKMLIRSWSHLLVDVDSGAVERRMGLLLLPLRELWKKEENGDTRVIQDDPGSRHSEVHVQAAHCWEELMRCLGALAVSPSCDIVWSYTVRPMATHWHRPVRLVMLQTLNALVRGHATQVGAWLCRAQGRRMVIETLQMLISTEARTVVKHAQLAPTPPGSSGAAAGAAAGASPADRSASVSRPSSPAVDGAEPGEAADVICALCDCWQACVICLLRSAADLLPDVVRGNAIWEARPTQASEREDKLRAISEILLAVLTPDPSHARALVHGRVRRRLMGSLRELCETGLVEGLALLWAEGKGSPGNSTKQAALSLTCAVLRAAAAPASPAEREPSVQLSSAHPALPPNPLQPLMLAPLLRLCARLLSKLSAASSGDGATFLHGDSPHVMAVDAWHALGDLMERVAHVSGRLGAQCVETIAPGSAAQGRRRNCTPAPSSAAPAPAVGRASFSAALVSAIKEAAPSNTAAKEQMDPGLANPLLSSVQSLPVGAGASSKPGAVELGAVILRAWRSTLAAFAAHFRSLSEGERASIATALGPALSCAMRGHVSPNLRHEVARLCRNGEYAEFMAAASVSVPRDLAVLGVAASEVEVPAEEAPAVEPDASSSGEAEPKLATDGDGGAGGAVAALPGERKRLRDAAADGTTVTSPPSKRTSAGGPSHDASCPSLALGEGGSLSRSAPGHGSSLEESASRLAALTDEQLRAADPAELLATLREAGREQARLHELSAGLARLHDRLGAALEGRGR